MNHNRRSTSKMGRLRTRVLELLMDPNQRPPGRQGLTIEEMIPWVDNSHLLPMVLLQLQRSFDVIARPELVVVLEAGSGGEENVRGLRLEFSATDRGWEERKAEARRERIRLKLAAKGVTV